MAGIRKASWIFVAALALGGSSVLAASPAAADAGGVHQVPDAIPGQYVVVLHDTVPQDVPDIADALTRSYGGTVLYTYESALQGFAARLNDAAADALSRNPRVEAVYEDGVVHADTTQSSATWGIDRIDQRDLPLSGTYNYGATGASVTAYIIDTGIRISHTDLAPRASIGVDEVGDGQNGNDCNGHGTHVSGTVGGTTYGVAKSVSLVAVRVLNCSGSGSYAGVIAGVDWVTQNARKPAVANMSLGGGAYSPLDTAIANSTNSGVTYAVAAGNSGADACNYSPARAPSALTVAATTSADVQASWSNYGTCVDLYAPGVSITSDWNTSNTATNTISGTSMATPHVAGTAALYLQCNPSASASQVSAAIVNNATQNHVSSAGAGTPNRLDYSSFVSCAGGGGGTATAPGAPSGLTASGNNASVHLSWTAPNDGGSAITNYKIYRSTVSGAETWLTTIGNTTVFDDNGVSNGTTYYYKVSAVNSVNEGPQSSEASATPLASTPPGAPTLTAIPARGRGVQLVWSIPPSGSSPITGYNIYRSTSSNTETLRTSVGAVTSFKDTATTRGVRYYYKIKAVSAAGQSAYSNEASATAN